MEKLKADLKAIVEEHRNAVLNYQGSLLNTIGDLAKDEKVSTNVNLNFLRFFGALSGSHDKESVSKLESKDVVELARIFLQNGENMAKILKESGLDAEVRLLESEITQLNNEIASLDEALVEAAKEGKEPPPEVLTIRGSLGQKAD